MFNSNDLAGLFALAAIGLTFSIITVISVLGFVGWHLFFAMKLYLGW